MERPLVVLLDTVETVIARGEAAVDDLGKWLDGLVNIARAPDVRAVVAGRDPIAEDSPFSIARSLARRGHRVEPEINLTNLDETDAQELLADAGIDDQVVAKAAAAALPCNPLVLRIAGDVFKDAPEAELENIRSDYLAGRVGSKDREPLSDATGDRSPAGSCGAAVCPRGHDHAGSRRTAGPRGRHAGGGRTGGRKSSGGSGPGVSTMRCPPPVGWRSRLMMESRSPITLRCVHLC